MLEKPEFDNRNIISALAGQYGLPGAELEFLPLGADQNSAAYRAIASDAQSYFVKLRRGRFDETSVLLPLFLADRGLAAIIPPLPTRSGRLWVPLEPFALIVYPFVDGRDGYQGPLSARQWYDLGRALRIIHTVDLPFSLQAHIRRESYSSCWTDALRAILTTLPGATAADPIGGELAHFLHAKRDALLDLILRTERLAHMVRAKPVAPVLCHSDIHAGNVLIAADSTLYVVDWDDPILAPKERDLMFIGAGLWGGHQTPQEEEFFFYRGYGPVQIDAVAIAYYRCARIVEDIALFSAHIMEGDKGPRDREQSLRYLKGNFLPNSTFDLAYVSAQGVLDS